MLVPLLTVALALCSPSSAADDAYLDHRRPQLEGPPSMVERTLEDVGDGVRELRNRILARPQVARPGAQIHTRADLRGTKRLPGQLEDRLLVSSGSPGAIATPGYLLRTGDELGQRGAVILPLQAGFDLHLHHSNQSRRGGELWMVVELQNPNPHVVEVWLGGAIHNSKRGRGRRGVFGGYGGPAAATAEAVLTRAERKGWSERVLHLHPGSKVRVITESLPHGHEIDGYYHVDASAPIHVDVRAIDPRSDERDDGAAGGWASGDGCGAAGVYHGARWATDGDMLEIPRPGRGRAYLLGGDASRGQAPHGVQTYRDACPALEGSHGVLHHLEIPLYNPSSRPQVVQLLLSAPEDGSPDGGQVRWEGPVMVEGWLQRVRLEASARAEVLGAWWVPPKELRTVHLDLMIPAGSAGYSALEVRTIE
jgi:hypothetical protein